MRYAVTRGWKRGLLHGFDAAGAGARAVWRRRALPEAGSARRVLLVRRERFGDLILLQPALRRAQTVFPRARITLLVNAAYAAFCAAAYPWVEVATEAEGEYDIGMEFLGDARLLWLARRRARAVVGYGLRGGGWLCDRELPYPVHLDAATRCVRLVEAAAGAEAAEPAAPRLVLAPEWVRAAAGLVSALPAKYVIVHPGCGDPAKAWPLERWRALAGDCLARGWPVVVTGTAEERAGYATLPGRNWAGATTLGALAGLVAEAAAVVAPDTGVVHLARALGVPAVALFGPTDPEVWGADGSPHLVVAYSRMQDIPVRAVLGALEAALSQAESAELPAPNWHARSA